MGKKKKTAGGVFVGSLLIGLFDKGGPIQQKKKKRGKNLKEGGKKREK